MPDWEAVEKELRGRGVTLRLLWLEYLSRHPEGYRYTQFCAHFHAWQRHSRPPTMCQQHRAGEALEVDYVGMTLSVIDKGVVRQAQIFVACLPCSDLTYAEASWTQGHEDWLGAHVRAFAYIGGFVGFRIPLWVRRLVTMIPAFVVVGLGIDATNTLVISQVVLSITLPLPMIALLKFTRRPDLMGRFVTGRLMHFAASIGAGIVLTLNGLLILQTFGALLPDLCVG